MESRRIRVIVADAHPVVRDGIAACLARALTIEVVGETADGVELCQMALRLGPDLVLMDAQMEEIDGIGLTRRLLGQCPHVDVLMLGTFGDLELVHRAMREGVRGYVLKSAPVEELLDGIHQVARGGIYLSEAIRKRSCRSQNHKPSISYRESQVLTQLGHGRSFKHISSALGVSTRTVETHHRNIQRKLKLSSRAQLVRYAVENCRRPWSPWDGAGMTGPSQHPVESSSPPQGESD